MAPFKSVWLIAAAFPLCFGYGWGQSQSRTAPQKSAASPATSARTAHIRAEIKVLEGILPTVRDKGAPWFLLARQYAQLGEQEKSLALLRECVSLDEGFNPDGVPGFSSLQSNPGYLELLREVRRRYPPVHRAQTAFTVEEKDLFPEGLAVDSVKHIFYMGSMYRRKIIKISESGAVSDFVKAGLYDLMPVGGVKVDADHSVWAATDPGEKNRSELVHLDEHGKLLERYAVRGSGPHDLNDLVIRNAREIYTTDSFANQVYRFDRRAHTYTRVRFPRPLLLPNGITFADGNNLLYVADDMGVIAVDLEKKTVHEVSPGRHNTLGGIDGLYWYKNSLLGVQYGTGVYRVARWRLSSDGLRVISTEVLERGTSFLSDPTTGAIFEGKFYFMANTGIYNLQDDEIVDPKKLEAVHVAVVELK